MTFCSKYLSILSIVAVFSISLVTSIPLRKPKYDELRETQPKSAPNVADEAPISICNFESAIILFQLCQVMTMSTDWIDRSRDWQATCQLEWPDGPKMDAVQCCRPTLNNNSQTISLEGQATGMRPTNPRKESDLIEVILPSRSVFQLGRSDHKHKAIFQARWEVPRSGRSRDTAADSEHHRRANMVRIRTVFLEAYNWCKSHQVCI